MPDGPTLKILWRCSVSEMFNTLLVGKVFRSEFEVLILGCEDGSVRFYRIPTGVKKAILEPFSCLETKGGPIQCSALHDVTKFGSIDLITGDPRGMVTIFSNGQILDRRHVTAEHTVSCIQVDEDSTGNMSIVISDTGGVVSAILPFMQQWKTKLEPRLQMKKSSSSQQVSVKTLEAFSVSSSGAGHAINYILAADNQSSLYVLQQGTVVLSLSAPSSVSAMCSGVFVKDVKSENGDPHHTWQNQCRQVALGCHNGTIHIFTDFQILQEMYANVKLPITQLKKIPSVENDKLDSLLCCGNFKAVLLLHGGNLLSRYEVSDLVVAMDTKSSDDCTEEIIVGCRDKNLFALRVG